MSSANWSGTAFTGRRIGLHAPRLLIRGVCAEIAERAAVPVWMPRTAFLIFGVLHWLLALILYFGLARVMCAGSRLAEPLPPRAPAQGAVYDRFAALDRRLAEMEAATVNQEAGLRRAFKDLERN